MKVYLLTSPKDIVQHWPYLKKGFKWLQDKTDFAYPEDETFQTISFLAEDPDRSFIAVAYDYKDDLVGFIVAFDSTPIFSEEKVYMIYALLHKPSNIRVTRRLLNDFELWAVSKGVHKFSVMTRKYGKGNISLFSRLGFRKDCLLLTKEL